jgi:dihydrofolate reductase
MIYGIACCDKWLGIGRNGKIPWDLPADMNRFRRLTAGGILIMGRKTYDSLPDLGTGAPLPGRMIVVLSSSGVTDTYPSVESVKSFETALDHAKELQLIRGGDIFIAGGEDVYIETLSVMNTIYLTVIDHDYKCDRYFPELSMVDWICTERRAGGLPASHPYEYRTYQKVKVGDKCLVLPVTEDD